jgi:hypothetical protein
LRIKEIKTAAPEQQAGVNTGLLKGGLIDEDDYKSAKKDVIDGKIITAAQRAPHSASRSASSPEAASASTRKASDRASGESPARKRTATPGKKKQLTILSSPSKGVFVKHFTKDKKCLGSTVNKLGIKFVDSDDEKDKKKYSCNQGCGFKTDHPPALSNHQKACFHRSSLEDLDDRVT